MEQFSIITGTKAIRDTLTQRLSRLTGLDLSVRGESVTLTGRDAAAKNKAVDLLAKAIVEEYGDKFLSKLIRQNYCYFNLPDKKSIYRKAQGYTCDERAYTDIVSAKLRDYLTTTDELFLEGFVNFRLREYQDELGDAVDRAVEDFMVEKEYDEFIKLLRYFVEIQTPKYEEISIFVTDGEYSLYSGSGEDITLRCMKEFMQDLSCERINSDDLLISSLISIAPRKISIHNPEGIKNTDLFTTIKRVFHGKITIYNTL